MEKLCSTCGLPGKFQSFKIKKILHNGESKIYPYDRLQCNDCLYKQRKKTLFKKIHNDTINRNHPNSNTDLHNHGIPLSLSLL